MALAELSPGETPVRRSVAQVRAAGRNAAAKLAESERLKAEAVVQLVEFDAIDAHVAEGFLTPQRHLIHRAGVVESEANRIQRLVRFCADHPEVANALANGQIGVHHAEVLRQTADHVECADFVEDLPDLLHAADGVEFSTFRDRVRTWHWGVTPEATTEDLETALDQQHLTIQPGLFGGCTGSFQFNPAGSVILAAAIDTEPDPVNTLEPARTLKQRRADRLIELCGGSLLGETACSDGEASGARQTVRPTVDVVIDLPTLLGVELNLEDHRDTHGDVDWDSIQAAFALTGSTPRPVLEQFFCDASWRSLITSGRSVVLDYTEAAADITPALRRAIQRRDQRCQFDGCDRHWSWCDVHHLIPREHGGPTTERNLALVCRRHHTMIHQAGWQLSRAPDDRLVTTSP